jgi:cation diffusion facilitator family transporter
MKNKRSTAQIFEGILSVIVNAALFGVKFWAGITTGSVALLADAWHTLSDSITSVFIIAAAKLASKKPDKEHPFGHGRWELVASILIAFILGMIGYEFFTDSIEKFQNREYAVYGTLALVVTAVSIVIKEALSQYAFYLGRKHKNPVITADGWHHRSDSLSSVIVLIGIVVTRFVDGLWWMDSVLGIICAAAIFWAAAKIMREAITKILGEMPGQEFIESLNAKAAELCGTDLRLHHIHLHNYISHKELTLHLMLDKNTTIEEGHKTATAIENMISEEFGIVVMNVMIVDS